MHAALTRSRLADAPSLPDDLSTERHFRHLAACRRVAVGPDLSLVFENRETLWFRLAELGSVARLTSAARVRRALAWYNRLLPTDGTLRAAVWLGAAGRRSPGCPAATAELRRAVGRGAFAFADATGQAVPGHFCADRVEDRLIGLAGWVEFPFQSEDAAAFATPGRGWHLTAEVAGERYASQTLADDAWRSLIADLG
jgi:hypothetical protein